MILVAAEGRAKFSMLSPAEIDGRQAVANCKSLPHKGLPVLVGADRIPAVLSGFCLAQNYGACTIIIQLNSES